MKRQRGLFLILLVSIALIGCDQLTKNLARTHLKGQPAKEYLGSKVQLLYVENTGAFLSLGADWSDSTSFWLLSVIPFLVMLGFLWYILRNRTSMSNVTLLAWLMVFSGGIGNLIDRLLNDRHVSDFIYMEWGALHTGVFNVADIYVTTGAILILGTSFAEGLRKKKDEPVTQDNS